MKISGIYCSRSHFVFCFDNLLKTCNCLIPQPELAHVIMVEMILHEMSIQNIHVVLAIYIKTIIFQMSLILFVAFFRLFFKSTLTLTLVEHAYIIADMERYCKCEIFLRHDIISVFLLPSNKFISASGFLGNNMVQNLSPHILGRYTTW